MRAIRKLLGLHDKDQAERTRLVSEYAEDKKNKFNKEMQKINRQAKKVHTRAMQAESESLKLKRMVDDVTKKIAIVTGNI